MNGVRGRTSLVALIIACLVSVTGTAMSAIALPWLVLTVTGDAGTAGLVVFAELTPYVLMQAVAGPWIDRVGARRTCVAGNIVAGVLVCLLPTLFIDHRAQIPLVLGLLAIAGATRGCADCANSSLLPPAVRVSGMSLERAAGLISSANRTGSLVGGALAGVLLVVIDAPLVVLIDGISFLAAAALLLLVTAGPEWPDPDHATEETSYRQKLLQGWRFIVRDRLIFGTTAINMTTNVFGGALGSVLLPAWVVDRAQSPGALGVMFTCLGLGGLVGSLAAAWLGPRLPRWATFSVGFLLGGAPIYFVAAATTAVLPLAVAALTTGLLTGALNPIVAAVQYERIPEQLLARVLGAIKAACWIGVALGPLIGGLAVRMLGVSVVLVGCGVLFLLITIAPFVLPVFKEMDRTPPSIGATPSATIGERRGCGESG